MTYYFKNLITAFCGRNPYRQQLDKLKEEMEKAGANVRMLQDSYYKEMEKAALSERLYESMENLLAESKEMLSKSEKQLTSYQTLVEILRGRCNEKDAMIGEMRKEYHRQMENYEKRVADYSVTIKKLQEKNEKLQKAIEEANVSIGKLLDDENRRTRAKEKKPRNQK